ncbi:hypothetical protein ACFV9C_41075 [Kribbella sp. NPDC059898]|uniref:hypothetical protein n=1 Tax=Kribbella sp. NPDC059898 TaxID=3346995 RepID=UPI00364E8C65
MTDQGPYTSERDVPRMHAELQTQNPEPWHTHAQRWTNASNDLQTASGNLTTALNDVRVWQQSTGSEAWVTFRNEALKGADFLHNWSAKAADIATRMNTMGNTLTDARGRMEQVLTAWTMAQPDLTSSNAGVSSRAKQASDNAVAAAQGELNTVSQALIQVLDKVGADFAKWVGPEIGLPGDPQTQPKGDGTETAKAGGGTGTDAAGPTKVSDDGKKPDEKKPDDTPAAKDPIEEAGKFLDVVAKVPEIADKGITALQHLKDLLTPSTPATTTTTGTTGTTTAPGSSMDGLVGDHPSLAGGPGTTTAPVFHPDTVLPPVTSGGVGALPTGSLGTGSFGHQSGTKESTPVQKSTTVAGTAGSEPTLAGKTSTTAATGTQQSTPPMYPPQNGGMGAGGNGARDIKPGAGPNRKPGFNVPAEQSETERMRRNGVQSDLQGRNGEPRAAGVPQRKRRRTAARAVERDVLDEDLWRI